MKKYLKVAIVQAKVPLSQKKGEANILKFVKQAKENSVDLIGVPEDCICGSLKPLKDYDPLEFLSKVAKDNNICIFGSNATFENGKLRGTGFFFDNSGNLLSKVHKIVLTPPEEKVGFVPGDKIEVFNTEFGKMAILICKDAFHRYTLLWIDQLKEMGVEYILVPSMSLKIDQNSVDYWIYSMWIFGRLFDIYILASGTVGPNQTQYDSFGNALIVDRDKGFLKRGSDDKEELLIAEIPVRTSKEIKQSYESKWQPLEPPKVKIVEV